MRTRSLPLLAALLALAFGGGAPALAQEATPAAADATFADAPDLPALEITLTDNGFEGVPDETEAGRYVVSFTNDASGELAEAAAIGFVRLPEGMAVADLAALAETAAAEPAGTPDPAMTEEEMAEGGEDPFAYLYAAYLPGGTTAGPGATGQAIVDLRAGDYAVTGDDPVSPIPPVAMTVTGDLPADLPEPEADVTVTEVGTAAGYAFELTGELAPGPQTIRIDNKSDQPHFVVLARSPEPITEEQLMALLELPEDATPPPGVPNPEEFVDVAYAALQSAGTTQWLATDLEPGYHVIACFVPDPNNEGIPHAAEGMADIIEVGEA